MEEANGRSSKHLEMYLENSEGFKAWLREGLTRGTWCDVPVLTTHCLMRTLFRHMNGNFLLGKLSNNKALSAPNACSTVLWRPEQNPELISIQPPLHISTQLHRDAGFVSR